jgi:hypothetical protein
MFMRLCVRIAVLFGLGMGLAGCSATREPNLVIAPSYSYVQDDRARGVQSATRTSHTDDPSFTRLPPLPSVPLFDPLVFRGSDQPDQPFE